MQNELNLKKLKKIGISSGRLCDFRFKSISITDSFWFEGMIYFTLNGIGKWFLPKMPGISEIAAQVFILGQVYIDNEKCVSITKIKYPEGNKIETCSYNLYGLKLIFENSYMKENVALKKDISSLVYLHENNELIKLTDLENKMRFCESYFEDQLKDSKTLIKKFRLLSKITGKSVKSLYRWHRRYTHNKRLFPQYKSSWKKRKLNSSLIIKD